MGKGKGRRHRILGNASICAQFLTFQVKAVFSSIKIFERSRHTTSFQRLYDVYTTSLTWYRRLIDVKTTSCVYWESLWIIHATFFIFSEFSFPSAQDSTNENIWMRIHYILLFHVIVGFVWYQIFLIKLSCWTKLTLFFAQCIIKMFNKLHLLSLLILYLITQQ